MSIIDAVNTSKFPPPLTPVRRRLSEASEVARSLFTHQQKTETPKKMGRIIFVNDLQSEILHAGDVFLLFSFFLSHLLLTRIVFLGGGGGEEEDNGRLM